MESATSKTPGVSGLFLDIFLDPKALSTLKANESLCFQNWNWNSNNNILQAEYHPESVFRGDVLVCFILKYLSSWLRRWFPSVSKHSTTYASKRHLDSKAKTIRLHRKIQSIGLFGWVGGGGCRGGVEGYRGWAPIPPLGQSFFVFMQFSGKKLSK